MDWLTLVVEIVGGVIVVVWSVVPIMEFRGIFRNLKRERREQGGGR